MAVIHVNGERYEVEGGENLLKTCLSLGLDVPYFCYHPALGSAGSCRQCAVKQYQTAEDAEAGKGRLVMSCMVETSDEMYISVDDAEAKAFREAMIELLMTNHPHDCPTCEEGGHCQLQDMTYMSGHKDRKYRFTKRTHNNQYLGPFINHEANRCIACYRCVRFYQNYAGGNDLGVFGNASRVFFGRVDDGVLESEFAGNLTEICPTGVFTDKAHSAHYTRKWDMQYAPSICQGCSVGCNISAGERYGELRRIENRYNGAINGYFLCDRGRYGYEYVNDPSRPHKPLLEDKAQDTKDLIAHLADTLTNKKILGIGSATASLESNFALKSLVGKDHFTADMSDYALSLAKLAGQLQQDAARVPNVREIEEADAVLILGEDITQTAARLALAVRQASKNAGKLHAHDLKSADFYDEPLRRISQDELSPIYIASLAKTQLDDIAQSTLLSDVAGIEDFAQAIVYALEDRLPKIDPHGVFAYAAEIAKTLKQSKNPLIISGTSSQSVKLMKLSAQIAQLIENAGLNLLVPQVNSLGIAALAGKGLDSFDLADYQMVILLESELLNIPQDFKKELKDKQLLVLNHQSSPLYASAWCSLPVASFAETDGTVISFNGNAQRFYQAFDPSYYHPDYQIMASWQWLSAIKQYQENQISSPKKLDDLIELLLKDEPQFAGLQSVAPNAMFHPHDMAISREPLRYSGRTSMRSSLSVHEPKQPQDDNSALAFSMEGYHGVDTPSALIPFAWSAGWNSPQAWNKYMDQVGGHIKGGDIPLRIKQLQFNYHDVQSSQANYQGIPLMGMYDLFASAPLRDRLSIFDQRERDAVIKMTPAIADKLAITHQDKFELNHHGHSRALRLEIDDEFADDCIGIVLQSGEILDDQMILQKVGQ